jgi:hypothetical protein
MRNHRTSNYARVMLTSYGPKSWDVGDVYGTLQRHHTLPGGISGQRINNDTKDDLNTEDTDTQPRNDMLWGTLAVVGVVGLAYLASRSSRGQR